jgi:hypothetical protein
MEGNTHHLTLSNNECVSTACKLILGLGAGYDSVTVIVLDVSKGRSAFIFRVKQVDRVFQTVCHMSGGVHVLAYMTMLQYLQCTVVLYLATQGHQTMFVLRQVTNLSLNKTKIETRAGYILKFERKKTGDRGVQN